MGFTADASGKARLSGKYRKPLGEDDFREPNPGLASEKKRLQLCPVVPGLPMAVYASLSFPSLIPSSLSS